DGRNDCWKTGHTDAIRECYELFIFNRWGQILYHTIDADDCWDGTTEEGKEASDGVYFYHLQIGTKIHKGSLQLMR
ncbi:MAG: gliding motility-associated C-terminal domain-containing protein, partial [Cryomorphaceae bacterium]|nr:gliding motility-associated C-terminal domain-containing protein [Cryomorphaceae bacterium]